MSRLRNLFLSAFGCHALLRSYPFSWLRLAQLASTQAVPFNVVCVAY